MKPRLARHFLSLASLAALLVGSAQGAPGPASFAYVLQADTLAKTRPEAVRRLAACGRDWVILDSHFSGEEPWTRADLDAIRRAQPGRKMLAYISIGEAEDYRAYWRKEWGTRQRLTPSAPA